MININIFINTITNTIPNIGIKDLFEIIIIIFAIYKIIIGIKDSRAWIVLRGILVLFFTYILAYILHFDVILAIFQWILYWGAIAIIMVFQGDIRRFLEKIGTQMKDINSKSIIKNIKDFFKNNDNKEFFYSKKAVDELADACFKMGKVKTGALIVIERQLPLEEWIKTGIDINATLSSALLINIFEKNTPLHDGAVIMRGNTIKSATCYLPLSENPNINKKLGTRHRAAIGSTEASDALVIIVSEETGNVSIAIGGQIKYNLSEKEFKEILYKEGEKISPVIKLAKEEKKTRNFKYEFLAIIIGFAFWLTMIAINDPQTTKTFYEIPVTIINENIVTDTGQTYDISYGETATVKIKDRTSIVNNIKENDIEIIADMKKMSYVYAIPLEASVKGKPEINIDIVGNSTMSIILEDKVSSEIPIVVKEEGITPEGYFIHEIVLDPAVMTVTTSNSIAKTLDEAVVTLDVSDITNETEVYLVPVIYDINGEIIPESKYSSNISSIKAKIEMYPTKSIPLKVNVSNMSTNDYAITSIDLSPKKIYIAGTEEALAGINEIIFEVDVNFDGNMQFVKNINLSSILPEGIEIANNDDKATITIQFKSLEFKTFEIDSSSVQFKNLSSNLSVTIDKSSFNIDLKGLPEKLNNISHMQIKPYLDLAGLGPGEYNLMLQFEPISHAQLANNISVKIIIEEI